MDAIVPLKENMNRAERRQFVREASNIVEDLEAVNASFLFELFDEDNQASYDSIYLKYLMKWKDTIAILIKSHKFEICAIDRMWFSNNYQPNA